MADEKYLNNRLKYHTASRVATQTGEALAQALNVDGHIVTANKVWASPQTAFINNVNKANTDSVDATNDLVIAFKVGATSKEFWNGGTVWTNPAYPAVRLYENVKMTTVKGSDGGGKFQAYEILAGEDGVSQGSIRIVDWIAPTAVADRENGKPVAGYSGIPKFKGTALKLADTDKWAEKDGHYEFVYMAGMLTFEPGFTPQDKASSDGTTSITLTAFKYIGEYLDTALTDLQSKEVKVKKDDLHIGVGVDGIQTSGLVTGPGNVISANVTVAENLVALDDAIADAITGAGITLDKDANPSGALSGYAAIYTLKQGSEQIGTINIPKDQFLKSAEYLSDTNELKFVWHLADEDGTEAYDRETIIPVSGLVDTYTAGSGLVLTGTEFNVNLGEDKYLGFDNTSALVIDGLDVADDGNYVKVDNTVAENLTALDIAVKAAEHDHAPLIAFDAVYNTVSSVTISGQTGTSKYITYSQNAGVFTIGAQGLDVAQNVTYNYITAANTVSGNLVALDAAIKNAEHSHATLTIGNTTYDTTAAATVKTADLVDLGALTGVVSGNAGIAVSEKLSGQVSISAVVKEGDLHLGIGTAGIETSGLVTADGNIISAGVTVATNLEALDAEIGDLVSGAYISGDVVASDLTRLDTQVKTNADAIANLIQDCYINIKSSGAASGVAMADEYKELASLLGTTEITSGGVVTIVFNKEVLEIGQREAASVAAFSGKFEDVYPDEEFDAETKTTTLSADFGDYLDDKVVQWRITYRN